jgi:hypothetical protein
MLQKAKSTPERSVSSSRPLAMWNTAAPRHSPFGPVGGPSTAHAQIIWQLQFETYFPDISQDMRTLLAGAVAKQKRPGFSAENT